MKRRSTYRALVNSCFGIAFTLFLVGVPVLRSIIVLSNTSQNWSFLQLGDEEESRSTKKNAFDQNGQSADVLHLIYLNSLFASLNAGCVANTLYPSFGLSSGYFKISTPPPRRS